MFNTGFRIKNIKNSKNMKKFYMFSCLFGLLYVNLHRD